MSKNTPTTPTPGQAQQRDKSDEHNASTAAHKPGVDASARAGQVSAHKGEADPGCGCTGGGANSAKGSTEDRGAESED